MQYYFEKKTRDLRLAFEREVLGWPKVTTKKMFGCPAYQAGRTLFAFLVTNGVVVTKLSEAERKALAKGIEIAPFQAGKRTLKSWAQISLLSLEEDFARILPFVRKSYESALKAN